MRSEEDSVEGERVGIGEGVGVIELEITLEVKERLLSG